MRHVYVDAAPEKDALATLCTAALNKLLKFCTHAVVLSCCGTKSAAGTVPRKMLCASCTVYYAGYHPPRGF